MAERKPWGLTDLRAITEEATSEWIHGDKQGMDLEDFTNRAIANAAVKKFMQYIDEHSHDEAQTWGSPAYRKCIALPVWKKVEQEVGL